MRSRNMLPGELLLSEFLPRQLCAVCGALGREWICGPCQAELPANSAACRRCALPLPVSAICPRCLRRPPPFDAVIVPLRYEFPVAALICRLKFNRSVHLAGGLGELLAGAVAASALDLPEALIPMPLHFSRMRDRGFNQAMELCQPLRHLLGVPADPRCCKRMRPTKPQIGLRASERAANVRGAFVSSRAGYRHVAIVDDVLTTGQTAGALSRALRLAGVRRIQVWALARAMA